MKGQQELALNGPNWGQMRCSGRDRFAIHCCLPVAGSEKVIHEEPFMGALTCTRPAEHTQSNPVQSVRENLTQGAKDKQGGAEGMRQCNPA